MPLFLTEEEHNRYINDAPTVIEKADSFIRDLYSQLETVKAQAEASSITAEQNCSLLEQQFVSLSADYAKLESRNAQLSTSLDQALSELAQVQSDKHQLHLKLMEKDGEIELLKMEVSEFHKSKRQSMEYLEQKDLEISEKNATIKSYLDRIVNLSENAAIRETRSNQFEAELARCKSVCTRLSQEKELIERHNVWLNDELEAKVDSLIQLRKTHAELEADMSTKLGDLERKHNECSSSLNRSMDRSKELESKVKSCQEELCSARDAAGTNEEQFSAEITTVNKLADLYKESSEEWSQKATELEGVIKALETHLSQVEGDYKSKLETEASTKKELEKTTMDLKEKLEKCEAEIESYRKANELNLLPLSAFTTTTTTDRRWASSFESDDAIAVPHMLIPKIPAGVSGTALAASLLRDGWSLSKMYSKYQEAVDALRHEQLGRKNSEAILQRVLSELEEKAEFFFDERAEHERMADAYSLINQKLQHSLLEQANLDQTILELKADLKKQNRDYTVAQRQIVDLQNQVTVLLKECRDIQLRGGSFDHDDSEDNMLISAVQMITESDADKVISERLLTFKNINGLVEQNAQLRSLVRNLTDQIATGHNELQEKFEMEIKEHMDEAASKVAVVMQRAEEQGRMIESLHTSVAMYKRLYEEEHKLHSSFSESVPQSVEGIQEGGMKKLMRLLEGSQEGSKNAKEQSAAKVRSLEEDLAKARNELISVRTERDKLSLEVNFAREKLDDFIKEFEHQRTESNGILARNVEFSQMIVDYQRKMRETSESINLAEELSRKLSMEVSVLKHEKEMLSNAEKRAYDEVRSLSERVYRLQASLDTMHSATNVREEARALERSNQEEHFKQVEREWAEAKRELQEERNNIRTLTLDREQTMNNAKKQVEDMRQELANALQIVANAEARATIAEARLSDLDKNSKSTDIEAFGIGRGGVPSSLPSDKVIDELRVTKEEMEKWKLEAHSNKDHMLQYKSISQVNEDALKQMESAHEDFKIEADKLKISLESELLSLKQRVHELESESCSKSMETASAAAGKAQALDSALSEIITLKQAISAKTGKITTMEIQISDLKEDLEKEHQRWCAAQANYERQVILQSETIQELTKTSQALALLQKEASELRKSADAYQVENNELKMKWEAERSVLEQLTKEAENKFIDINEQNKILHNRLEVLHIQLAEKDRSSAGRSFGETVVDPVGDFGLQNVVNYLRRSKEIAETEISLLKQEKLRFQSQLGNALKTAEAAEASLHAERAKSRALLLTGEEIKSLQLQVREMNLLRESNIQLREENKHNFEEWQKYRAIAQRACAEKEYMESQLKEKDVAIESCQNAINALKAEKDNLEKRAQELHEKFQSIDVENYHCLKGDVQLMQIKIEEKDALIETLKKQLSESQDKISKLEQDVANGGSDLKERDMKINDLLKAEATLKAEVEKQKKVVSYFKAVNVTLKRTDKEKEEVSKENQALSRQLEELKQGKGSVGDLNLEQAMKEKDEKDQKLQSLEKLNERLRDELKKGKDSQRVMKNTCLKDDDVILFRDQVVQERTKFLDEFERHKKELKRLHEEVENLKHLKSRSNLPEVTPFQHLSETVLDDRAADYSAAVENLNTATQTISGDPGSCFLANTFSKAETSSRAESSSVVTVTGQEVPIQTSSSTVPPAGPGQASLPPKVAIQIGKRPSVPKTNVETRKPVRRLVRPRLLNTEEAQGDTEMSEADVLNSGAKLDSSQDFGTPGNITLLTQPSARKRQAISSLSEVHEELATNRDTSLKKAKGSDSQQDSAEVISITLSSEVSEIAPNSVEIVDAIDSGNGVTVDTEKNALEITDGQTDNPKEPLVDETSPVDLQNEEDDILEDLFNKPTDTEMPSSDLLDDEAEQDLGQSTMDSDREEGEMAPDADVEAGELTEPMLHEASPNQDNDPSAHGTENIGDPESVEVLNDEVKDINDGSDKLNEATEQTPSEINQISELLSAAEGPVVTPTVVTEVPVSSPTIVTEVPVSTPTTVGNSISGEGSSSVTRDTEETRQPSPVGNNSTTMIMLEERAKIRAQERTANMQTPANIQTSSPARIPRGRSVVSRSRGIRGGRSFRGRRPPSNEQS